MTKVFCDSCGNEISTKAKRCEFAISWSVPINVQDRQDEYEICFKCAQKLKVMLSLTKK